MPATDSDKLELNAWLTFDWKANAVVGASFQAAIDEIEAALLDAQERAQERVAIGKGPSPHAPGEEQGTHKRGGFFWEDTGNLADAIDIERSYKETENGKWVGLPHGRLVVKPIETEDGRLVNYGAYLEVGFHPVIKQKTSMGYAVKQGRFTRYPFLSPSLLEATQGIEARVGMRLTRELVDMTARSRGRKAIVDRREITVNSAAAIKNPPMDFDDSDGEG
jgi:hypothetical protein